MRPGPEPALRDLEAPAAAEDHVVERHAHVLEHDLAMAVGRVEVAEHRQHALDAHAGRVQRHQHQRVLLVAVGLRIGAAHEERERAARVADAGGPPLASVEDDVVALERDVACMLVASLDATSGSVMQNAERISPASSGSSQRCFCSGEPKWCSTSMLPVSGALQLKTSGANGTRPMASATGA